MNDNKEHWESVYQTKTSDEMSWSQATAEMSLRLIERSGVSQVGSIIDVGSGTTVLIRSLLERGYKNLTVLDISEAAIAAAKIQAGPSFEKVKWVTTDILKANLPHKAVDLWHDRAVFHFLTSAEERSNYIAKLKAALKPRGHVLIATFGLSGPEKCSGLPVCRYDPDSLLKELGNEFRRVCSESETHQTPWGKSQDFIYCLFELIS